MDDLMILFHNVIVDIVSFDESQFSVFNDSERATLVKMFNDNANHDITRFIAMLTPQQKERVALWACERSSFSVDEMIESLEKFTKYLRGVRYNVYPKTAPQPEKKKSQKKRKGLSLLKQ